jgi:luciferase family oxidoreductase group 1
MSSKKISNTPLSVLELALVTEEHTATDSLKNALDLAQKAEKLGYERFWLAEHHNMVGVASSATSVLIGYIAGGTSTIRVGSGGIMLPNHAPLIVAEQFGTLATLYPNRIDLGLGRAPGTDQLTVQALRRDRYAAMEFPQNVKELQTYLSADNSTASVRAFPGEGLDIPIWILGSSTDSAYLAASMGLPYAFASHFAPAHLHAALRIYHENFVPSKQLKKPYTIACINIIAADTDQEAAVLETSLKQQFLGILTGKRQLLQAPNPTKEWDPVEEAALEQMLAYTFVGGAEKLKTELQVFLDKTQVDELMIASAIYDHEARIKSYEIVKNKVAI